MAWKVVAWKVGDRDLLNNGEMKLTRWTAEVPALGWRADVAGSAAPGRACSLSQKRYEALREW